MLRLGVNVREDNLVLGGTAKHLYTTNKLEEYLADCVLAQYKKANDEFKPPVISSKKSLHTMQNGIGRLRKTGSGWNLLPGMIRRKIVKVFFKAQ